MAKMVQIPESLFVEICKYHLLGVADAHTRQTIEDGLNDKMEAITRRDLYSKSKSAPTKEEREKYRNQYLDAAGVPAAFRR